MRHPGPIPIAGRAVDWRTSAACLDHADDMFPDTNIADVEKARAFCRRCPSIEPCLQAAFDEEGDAGEDRRHGIRGGQTKRQRWRAHEEKLTARQVLDRQRADEECKAADVAALQDLYDLYTVHSPDGHLIWTGPHPLVAVPEGRLTVGKLAFRIGVGRDADGAVQRSCDRELCFLPAHLTDQAMRSERKAAS